MKWLLSLFKIKRSHELWLNKGVLAFSSEAHKLICQKLTAYVLKMLLKAWPLQMVILIISSEIQVKLIRN